MFILSFYFYAYATCNLGSMKEVIIKHYPLDVFIQFINSYKDCIEH